MKILPDALEFETVDDLCIFLRYDAKNTKSIPPGYVLAEDMLNNKGGVLYAKDTELDASRIGRLIRIIENTLYLLIFVISRTFKQKPGIFYKNQLTG